MESTQPTSNAKPARVFISYSHDSDSHMRAVREFADELRRRGFDAQIDQYALDPDEGWPRWMQRQLDMADFVLIVPTEPYLRRWKGEEEPDKGLGATWEGLILTSRLYLAQGRAKKLRCVLVGDGTSKYIPEPLAGHTYFDIPDRLGDLERYLLHLPPGVPAPTLGPCPSLSTQWTQPAPQAWNRRQRLERFLTERYPANWELGQLVSRLPDNDIAMYLLGEDTSVARYVRELVGVLMSRGELARAPWWTTLHHSRPNFKDDIAELELMWR